MPMGNVVKFDHPETRIFCGWFMKQYMRDRKFTVPIDTQFWQGVFGIKEVRQIQERLKTKQVSFLSKNDENMFWEFNLIERSRIQRKLPRPAENLTPPAFIEEYIRPRKEVTKWEKAGTTAGFFTIFYNTAPKTYFYILKLCHQQQWYAFFLP